MELKELHHNRWNIGFVEEGLKDSLTTKRLNIHWAKKKFKDRWFADPFILDVNDKVIVILAEEYCYRVRRGRLARVVFDRQTYKELSFTIILDLPTHLSFPFIYRKNEIIYIVPENSASGTSTIYEYNDVTQVLTSLHHVYDKPLTDATIVKAEGEMYMFTTISPTSNGRCLSIYKFDDEKLKTEDKSVVVPFSQDTARNAGECFDVDGVLYRPAQDCTKSYGNGVVLQRVKMKGGKWEMTDVNSFYPKSFLYNQGVHTFNHYVGVNLFIKIKDDSQIFNKQLIVVDGRGYRFPIIGRIITFLFKCLKYFK